MHLINSKAIAAVSCWQKQDYSTKLAVLPSIRIFTVIERIASCNWIWLTLKILSKRATETNTNMTYNLDSDNFFAKIYLIAFSVGGLCAGILIHNLV